MREGGRIPWSLPFVVALVVACDPGPPEDESSQYAFEARVDCLSMNWVPTWGNDGAPTLHEGITPMPLAGELTISEEDYPVPDGGRASRCYYRFPSKSLQVGREQVPWEIDGPAYLEGAIFQVQYRGRPWYFVGGELVVDELSSAADWTNSKGRGHYDADFISNGEVARIQGEFDWCDPLRHGDCPYSANNAFQPQWTLDTDWTNTYGTAAECRMVVDASTGGLQVDMQIGSVLDADVTQIYALWCGWIGAHINANRFTFRSGGVDGPGEYGPYVVTSLTDDQGEMQQLPGLSWELPLTLSWIFPNETQGCALSPGNGGNIQTDVGATCTFEVSEDRFVLDCDQATYWSGFFATPKPNGALHFESDCELVTLN